VVSLFASILIDSLLFWKRLPVLPVFVVVKITCSIPYGYGSNIKWSFNLDHCVASR